MFCYSHFLILSLSHLLTFSQSGATPTPVCDWCARYSRPHHATPGPFPPIFQQLSHVLTFLAFSRSHVSHVLTFLIPLTSFRWRDQSRALAFLVSYLLPLFQNSN